MEEYTKVEVTRYVKQGIESGTMMPRYAKKFSKIIARQGTVGETVISWSVDEKGNEIQEKVDQVKIDEKTNQPGWVVTKVDEHGNVIVDNNNHSNQWIIGDSTFKDTYEVDSENPNLWCKKGVPQIFVQIPDNIILHQWDSDMKIAAGGYINITNANDMYGISKRDFDDSYRFIDDLEKSSPRL